MWCFSRNYERFDDLYEYVSKLKIYVKGLPEGGISRAFSMCPYKVRKIWKVPSGRWNLVRVSCSNDFLITIIWKKKKKDERSKSYK